MSGVNKVILVGRLGKEPEIRFTPSGDCVASVSLATSESWKDKTTGEKKEKTEWHRLVFWRKLAEIVDKWVAKGDMIYIEGKLETRKWQDKEGNDRYTTEIVCHNMQMLGSKNKDGQQSQRPAQQPARQEAPQADIDDGFDDDIPF